MSRPTPPGDKPQPREELLDAAEQLIWSVIDEEKVEDAQIAQLESLLLEHEEVRDRYLDCVQLHVDLHEHFASPDPGAGEPKKSVTVLGSLLSGGFSGPLPAPAE
ncbi:MAG: hypothetical protein KF688_11440 [Pirellulales bacterium]|nr:hypothetical protein [Pirellulales bacterium]